MSTTLTLTGVNSYGWDEPVARKDKTSGRRLIRRGSGTMIYMDPLHTCSSNLKPSTLHLCSQPL